MNSAQCKGPWGGHWGQLQAGSYEPRELDATRPSITHQAKDYGHQERGIGKRIYAWLEAHRPEVYGVREIALALNIEVYKVSTNIPYVPGLVRSGAKRSYRYTVVLTP